MKKIGLKKRLTEVYGWLKDEYSYFTRRHEIAEEPNDEEYRHEMMEKRLIRLFQREQETYGYCYERYLRTVDPDDEEYWHDRMTSQSDIMEGVARAAGEALGISTDSFIALCHEAWIIKENAKAGAGEELNEQGA